MSSLYLQLYPNKDKKEEDLQLYMYVHCSYMADFRDYQRVLANTTFMVCSIQKGIYRESISPVGEHTLVERRCQ